MHTAAEIKVSYSTSSTTVSSSTTSTNSSEQNGLPAARQHYSLPSGAVQVSHEQLVDDGGIQLPLVVRVVLWGSKQESSLNMQLRRRQ